MLRGCAACTSARDDAAGAGVKVKREAMTGEQMMKLEAINAQTREQDNILDELSRGLDELHQLAERMGDELQLQDKMLDDLDEKTDKTQSKLDATNDRMKVSCRAFVCAPAGRQRRIERARFTPWFYALSWGFLVHPVPPTIMMLLMPCRMPLTS